MSSKTPFCHLSQWELSDKPMLEDFNSDNRKIDKQLQELDIALSTSQQGGDALSTRLSVLETLSAPILFTLPVSAWESSVVKNAGCEYHAVLTIPGITENDLVRVDFNIGSLLAAEVAGVMASGDTVEGGAIFWAMKAPETDLSGTYTVHKAVV